MLKGIAAPAARADLNQALRESGVLMAFWIGCED
jgi:hypothetical protein